jgi:Leucine-rich repeat (LRR) protein
MFKKSLEDTMGGKKSVFMVVLFFSLIIGINQKLFAQINEQDSLALVALYDSTNGANWTNYTNWLTGPVSTWYGVEVLGDRVTKIELRNNNLIGTIPPDIGSLTNLEYLYLDRNQLSGSIPTEIGNLFNLKEIALFTNQLKGPIPSEIGYLTQLESLIIAGNQLTGSFPNEICNLTNLRSLDITNNQLGGSVPTEISNLINLTLLSMGSNQFTGTIPPGIGNLTKLTYLYLAANQLSGSIPKEIGNLINLNNLQLSVNQLSESIPVEIGKLTKLTTLYLDRNNLSCSIPHEFFNLINLTNLTLYQNQLSDSISSDIGNLINLTRLLIHSNQFTGSIPAVLGNLSDLQYLYLNGNQFTGAVPTTFSNFVQLKKLYIYDNQLTDLPDLSPDTSLKELRIENNQFTFEDIEPNLFVTSFLYSPQDSVGEEQDTTIEQSSSLDLSVTVGGTTNQYQWMKDGVEIPDADGSSYTILSADSMDAGFYHCRITNTIATQLTLYCRPIQVTVNGITGVAEPRTMEPESFALYQNYPNPFNPLTTIRFSMPEKQSVRLSVYNLLGQLVRTLVDEKMEAGQHSVVFNAAGLASGVYFYRLHTESFISIKPCILIK